MDEAYGTTTYEQAIARAAKSIAEAFFRIQEGTAREATERAYTPGGPTVDELEVRIHAWRDKFMGAGLDDRDHRIAATD